MSSTLNQRITLPSGVNVFYREQVPATTNASTTRTIILFHGFPTSSHQYRNLIPLLAAKHRVIAPDLPGFGFTEVPSTYKYSFEALASTVAEFLDTLAIAKFSAYVFDYGAPVCFRLALQRPQAIEAIITQNGNAYVDGLGDAWAPVRDLWASGNTAADRQRLSDAVLTMEATRAQYETGEPDLAAIAPETYTLDQALMERPGNKDIQVDLFLDYQNNIALYPRFQEFFRASQVPLLAVWGKNDSFFIPRGAEAYQRDLPKAVVKLIDAGHFAGESHTDLIAQEILSFLA